MIWFIADTHLGCERLVEYTRTQFRDVNEHDDFILGCINSCARRDDTLVIVGDFCKEKPGRYRPRIKCKNIHFILGNHDKEAKIRRVFGGNVWHSRMYKIKGATTWTTPEGKAAQIWACHYPTAFWPDSHNGAYHVYGHIHHKTILEKMMDVGLVGRRSIDVGVDHAYKVFGEYRPFSQQNILNILRCQPGHDIIKPEDRWNNENQH